MREAEVWLSASETIQEHITVSLSCDIAWFHSNTFEDSCPTGNTQTISATYQAFEHGYMLQRTNSDSIWFYNNTTDIFYVRPVNLIRDAVLFSDTVPIGFHLPTGNFGDLWTGSAFVRDQLGWATTSVQTYTMQYQESLWALGTRLSKDRLFTLPDGTVIYASIDDF